MELLAKKHIGRPDIFHKVHLGSNPNDGPDPREIIGVRRMAQAAIEKCNVLEKRLDQLNETLEDALKRLDACYAKIDKIKQAPKPRRGRPPKEKKDA